MVFTLSAQNNILTKNKKCCPEKKTEQSVSFFEKSILPKKTNTLKSTKGASIDTTICFDWNGTAWVYVQMFVYRYDSAGNLTQDTYHEWDGTAWKALYTTAYFYDVNGNEIENIEYIWDDMYSNWFELFKTEHIYDGTGLHLESINYSWTGSDWQQDGKMIYNWSGSVLDAMISQTWDGTSWVNSMMYTYQYGVMMELLETIAYLWNGTDWEELNKDTFTYDANMLLIEEIFYMWNGSGWDNSNRHTYVYDANGNEIESVFSQWNNGAWEDFDRTLSSYDANNNLIEEIYENWDGSAWLNDVKLEFTFDANSILTEIISYYWDGTTWIYNERCIFLHYDLSVGINESNAMSETINIYPNPANDIIKISSSYKVDIQIINTQGQILQTEEVKGEIQIDISLYPKGLYFIRSTSKVSNRVDKIIKT